MLIIDRALMRDTFQSSLAVSFIFLVLFLVISLVNGLAKAALGDVPVAILFTLLGLETVKTLALMLPLSVFIGILLGLGRWYRDNEMTVLAACGLGIGHFLRPIALLAAGFALVVGLFSFYLEPLASGLIHKAQSSGNNRYEVSGIIPGTFNRVKGGGFFYVGGVDRATSSLRDIFVNNEQLGKQGVLFAKTGHYYRDRSSGDQYLVLDNGTRYEGSPGQADYRILQFQTYIVRIVPRAGPPPPTQIDAMSLHQLLQANNPNTISELHWRIAKPVTLFILAFIAVAFAYTNPRRGRYAGLFSAILVYFVYANLLAVGDALIKSGRVSAAVGLWWVHGIFAVLAVYLLWRRAANRPLVPRPRFLRG
ncbi:MAG: LPS export ABC transporter permease LptF [Gammaproteobacteria bacterium]|nr:LPS export ABC transporter permease LptF [Gammaproteobacteria bacterium]